MEALVERVRLAPLVQLVPVEPLVLVEELAHQVPWAQVAWLACRVTLEPKELLEPQARKEMEVILDGSVMLDCLD